MIYNREYSKRDFAKRRHCEREKARYNDPDVAESKREYSRKWGKEYRQQPEVRERARLSTQNYRARKGWLKHGITTQQWNQTLRVFQHRCAYCGRPPEPGAVLHHEHVIPTKLGGDFVIGNIVPACGFCNASKGAKHVIRWMAARGYDIELFQERLRQLGRKENLLCVQPSLFA